jgi:hypothetical protein
VAECLLVFYQHHHPPLYPADWIFLTPFVTASMMLRETFPRSQTTHWTSLQLQHCDMCAASRQTHERCAPGAAHTFVWGVLYCVAPVLLYQVSRPTSSSSSGSSGGVGRYLLVGLRCQFVV